MFIASLILWLIQKLRKPVQVVPVEPMPAEVRQGQYRYGYSIPKELFEKHKGVCCGKHNDIW